jgi:uroporphyrin-III C-methyltransferase
MLRPVLGKVYLVGAGPGKPDLITVRGLELLREADVVIYDRLVHPSLVGEAPAAAIRIFVGKSSGSHTLPQEEINDLLIAYARCGRQVVRLKGGDPFIFGRGGEEVEALGNAGVPYEVVPGVSSAIAAPAYAGIPLTHREYSSSVAIVTGHKACGGSAVKWEQLAAAVDTLVILMGLGNLKENMSRLMAGGCEAERPVALVRWGTRASQEILVGTIADMAEQRNFSSPAVIVVGDVVRFSNRLHFSTSPFANEHFPAHQ